MSEDIERLRQAALRDPAQFVRLADALVAHDRADEAVQACRSGLSKRPDDVPLRLALGRALSATGQLEEAQAVLTQTGARPEQVIGGSTVVSRVENGGRAVPAILSALDGAGIGVASVSVSRPSLDDVYLHFTGRDFRSEDRGG